MTPAVPPPFLVLAADDPERLAVFYGALLQTPWREQAPATGACWGRARGGWRSMPRRASVPAPAARAGWPSASPVRRGGPTLQVLRDWHTAMLALGAIPVEPPRQEPFGAEAWLADPEGNRLLLLVSAA